MTGRPNEPSKAGPSLAVFTSNCPATVVTVALMLYLNNLSLSVSSLYLGDPSEFTPSSTATLMVERSPGCLGTMA